jgi:hypothetical protein
MKILDIALIAGSLSSLVAGCAVEDAGATGSSSQAAVAAAWPPETQLFAYSAEAAPLGVDLARWGETWWKWIYAQPAAHNPIFDPSGADCGVGDQGPVVFLASVVDPGGVATIHRSCTVPAHRPILISPSGSLNDFPCPDPVFRPESGQSMFGFLKAGIAPIVNSVDLIEVTLDGVALPGTLAYRATSERTFSITGDPSLASRLDGCITGTPQAAVSDGYFMMLRGLSTGPHELVIRARDRRGTDVTIDWTLAAAR